MAQPRKASPSSSRKPAARKPTAAKKTGARKPSSTAQRPVAARSSPVPVPNPLDLVILTRDRVQDLFDDAVARGRMTRDDASDLVAGLLRSGLKQTDDLRSDVEQLLGRSRDGAADRLRREVDKARRAVGVGPSFPISAFDDLTAAQVTDRLADLTPAQLRKVRDHERRNANRKSVLSAIESRLG